MYTEGVWVLAVLAASLLILFGGVTDRLIPLFAVGAFLAFTMSQAGMVAHWRRTGGRGAKHSMLINAVGAAATAATTAVILAAKFAEGAWVVVLLIPAMLTVMTGVRRHYRRVERETAPAPEFVTGPLRPPLVIVPIETWNSATQKALRFALTLAEEVQAVHVQVDEDDALSRVWQAEVEEPARKAGLPVPKLVVMRSPYRMVIQPILDYVLEVERSRRDRQVAVVIAALVERHWYHFFLHNQRGQLLSALLVVKGDRRISIVNVPWYIES